MLEHLHIDFLVVKRMSALPVNRDSSIHYFERVETTQYDKVI
jgi:hypothetical protein